MDNSDKKIKVLFSQSHRELLNLDHENEYRMSLLQKLLIDDLGVNKNLILCQKSENKNVPPCR